MLAVDHSSRHSRCGLGPVRSANFVPVRSSILYACRTTEGNYERWRYPVLVP